MASFNNQNSGLQFMTAMASNFNVAGDLPIEDVHNPSNDAVQNDFNADTSATLHPVCPDPDVGYQPLSDYLVAKLLRRTMQYFKKDYCKRLIRPVENGLKPAAPVSDRSLNGFACHCFAPAPQYDPESLPQLQSESRL